MNLRIDKTGRIVVPKPMRERLGLREGMELEISESAEGLLIKPVKDHPPMIQVKGLWVHQGSPPGGFDWNRHIEEEREERQRKVHGL